MVRRDEQVVEILAHGDHRRSGRVHRRVLGAITRANVLRREPALDPMADDRQRVIRAAMELRIAIIIGREMPQDAAATQRYVGPIIGGERTPTDLDFRIFQCRY